MSDKLIISDKFKNIPIEKDTKIVFEMEANLDGYKVKYELWLWDGIWAESIIFDNEDIKTLNQTEIETLVKSSPVVKPDSKITYNKSDSGFTFVNFNFHVKD